MIKKIILLLLVLLIPVCYYFFMQYSMWAKDYSLEIVMMESGDRKTENGKNKWGHDIPYYEKEGKKVEIISDIFKYSLYINVILIAYMSFTLLRKKSNPN